MPHDLQFILEQRHNGYGGRQASFSKNHLLRRMANHVMNRWFNYLFKARILDVVSGMRVIRLAKFKDDAAEDFDVDHQMAAIAVASSMRIQEIPIDYQKRLGIANSVKTSFYDFTCNVERFTTFEEIEEGFYIMKTLTMRGKGLSVSQYIIRFPKVLAPIGDKPILVHIMDYYARYGFNEFILCLGEHGTQIQRSIENEVDYSVTFLDTGLDTHRRPNF